MGALSIALGDRLAERNLRMIAARLHAVGVLSRSREPCKRGSVQLDEQPRHVHDDDPCEEAAEHVR